MRQAGECCCAGRMDREPWEVRTSSDCAQQTAIPGTSSTTSRRGEKGGCPPRAQSNRKPVQNAGRRIGNHREALDPLEEATTASLEALKAYSTAVKVFLSSGSAPALPLFKRAIAIDPNFAMAHARLGISCSGLGESVLARESTLKAYQLRDLPCAKGGAG